MQIILNMENVLKPPMELSEIGKSPVTTKLNKKLNMSAILMAWPLYLRGKTSEINKSAIGPSDIENDTI